MDKLYNDLGKSVFEMNINLVEENVKKWIDLKNDPLEGIKALAVGMQKAGEKYETGEYFIPELIICSDAMYKGLELFEPYLPKDSLEDKKKVVIGVVEGDTHDIGKNLVKTMLETSGFEVYDLGRDVKKEDFISKIQEVNADILVLSTLMTTTMDSMREVIDELKELGIREDIKVMIGGGPISKVFAEEIGADYYTSNASTARKCAVKIVKENNNA